MGGTVPMQINRSNVVLNCPIDMWPPSGALSRSRLYWPANGTRLNKFKYVAMPFIAQLPTGRRTAKGKAMTTL
jgi:hypothetical protein